MASPSPELPADQVTVLRHALGLDRRAAAYRNHFCADVGHTDWAALQALVQAGLMVQRRSAISAGWIFFVTDAGRAAIAEGLQA